MNAHPMTTKELLALVADCKPCGEWEVTDTCSDYVFKIVRAGTADIDAGNESRAALIVAAVNALPALCAEVEALRKDAERYRWLRDNSAHSFSVSRDNHKASYMPADEYMECDSDYYDEIDPVERARMVTTNTIWSVHVYPNTPVGFNVYHAATLDAALDAAMGGANEQRKS